MHRHSTHVDPADRAFDLLLASALEAYVRKQEAFQQSLAPFSRWSLNDAGDILSFTADSLAPLDFPVTPIATYVANPGEWAWAWANDGFGEPARLAASRLKSLTAKTGYNVFESPFFDATLQDIDELCALALHELGGVAVFKVKDQEPWYFYVVR